MMANFKKGDVVYLFSRWNREGMYSYRKFVVMSCGKKQATLQSMDGEMFKSFVYMPWPEGVVADGIDPIEVGQRLANKWNSEEIAHMQCTVEHYRNRGDESGVKHFEAILAESVQVVPQIRSYDELHSELMTRLAAKHSK